MHITNKKVWSKNNYICEGQQMLDSVLTNTTEQSKKSSGTGSRERWGWERAKREMLQPTLHLQAREPLEDPRLLLALGPFAQEGSGRHNTAWFILPPPFFSPSPCFKKQCSSSLYEQEAMVCHTSQFLANIRKQIKQIRLPCNVKPHWTFLVYSS